MAFRSKAAALCLLTGAALLRADVAVAVRHDHLRGEGQGQLVAGADGLTFVEDVGKPDHGWRVAWDDIQQLFVAPGEVRVLTYADSRWRLGADRERRLKAAAGVDFRPLYLAARDRLGRKLVAAMPEEAESVLWEVPVKLKKGFGGSEGVLAVGADAIVYRSPEKNESRSWRLSDIENVSSSGPFDLTIVTYERAKGSYADRRSFTFQLKQPLDEERYRALWRRVSDTNQPEVLRPAQE